MQVDGIVALEHGPAGDQRAGSGCAAGGPVGTTQHHQVLELGQLVAHGDESLGEAHVLDDRHGGAAVPGQVGDLLGRRGVVDRHRGGAAEHRREVDHVELGDVAHHQHDPLARPHAERPQARGGPGHPVAEVGERPLDPAVAVLRPQRHVVRMGGQRLQPPADDRLSLDLPIELVLGCDHAGPPGRRPRMAVDGAPTTRLARRRDGPE
jgi:hypothetical protein